MIDVLLDEGNVLKILDFGKHVMSLMAKK